VIARNPDNYNPLVEEINTSGGTALGLSADLSDSSAVSSVFDKISQQFKDAPLAAAVFNSGGGFVRKPFLELTEEEFTNGFRSQGYIPVHFPQSASILEEYTTRDTDAYA
jgi:NAD(P)-dependent dehydrogenase (short-subunit alcohol dehydrogenase family)